MKTNLGWVRGGYSTRDWMYFVKRRKLFSDADLLIWWGHRSYILSIKNQENTVNLHTTNITEAKAKALLFL